MGGVQSALILDRDIHDHDYEIIAIWVLPNVLIEALDTPKSRHTIVH